MEENKKKKIIKVSAFWAIAGIILAMVGVIMLKYEVEGEKNMPFHLTKISIISTAEGIQRDGAEEKWNMELIQKNDIYFQIEKNENFKKEDILKSVSFENFQVTQAPAKGNMFFYMPTDEGVLYKYKEEYKINERLQYKGALNTNMNFCEIGNQGGLIGFSSAITELGEYKSNEDETILHDGTLLNKVGMQKEDLISKISFDIIIKTEAQRTYKANVVLELPTGNILEEGICSIEKTDFKDVIFKRI